MKYIFVTLLGLSLWLPSLVAAASFGLRNDTTLPHLENQAAISVFLTAPNENINALGGELVILSGKGVFEEIQDGQSIISSWIERPRSTGSSIVFSGIIPGGFSGQYSPFVTGPQPGPLFTALLRSDDMQNVVIGWKNVEMYRDSGEKVEAVLDPRELVLSFGIGSNSFESKESDTSAPIFASYVVQKLPGLPDAWYLVFSAEDSGSGIEQFKVQENRTGIVDPTAWQNVETPYHLLDQKRKSHIFIAALDRSGNETVVSIPPAQINIFDRWPWGVLIIIVLFSLFIFVRLRQKRSL